MVSICGVNTAYADFFKINADFITGISNGQINETLEGPYSRISKLTWSEPVCFNAGFEGKVKIKNFDFNAGFNMSIPNEWGKIEDYDYYTMGGISQYSKHDCHINNQFSIFINAGYCFQVSNFSFCPLIEIDYQSREISAWNGYIQSPEKGKIWTGEEDKQVVTGNGVSYYQKIFLPFAKIDVICKLKNNFSLSGIFGICPYVHADCIDMHYLRSKQFTDEIRGGFSISGEFKIQYERYGFKFSCLYLKSSSNAKTYKNDTGLVDSSKELIENYIPGIDSVFFNMSLIYSF